MFKHLQSNVVRNLTVTELDWRY